MTSIQDFVDVLTEIITAADIQASEGIEKFKHLRDFQALDNLYDKGGMFQLELEELLRYYQGIKRTPPLIINMIKTALECVQEAKRYTSGVIILPLTPGHPYRYNTVNDGVKHAGTNLSTDLNAIKNTIIRFVNSKKWKGEPTNQAQ